MENKDFFNLSLDIMCVINENNQIENANKALENILGYKEQELIGKKITEFVHPEDVDKTLNSIDTLKNKKELTNLVSRYMKKNGEYCYLEWRATYHNNKIYAIAREINEKIDIQNKLISNKDNFRDFVKTIDSMVFIGDENFKIIYVNEKVEEKLNYKNEELIGKSLLNIYQKEKRNETEKIFSNILKTKKRKCLLPLETKEGYLIPVDSKIWIGEWNNEIYIYVISQDLTKEQENFRKFNKIFQNNPALMSIHSFETREFIDANDTLIDILGYKREEVIGKTIKELGIVVDNKTNTFIEKKILDQKKVENFQVKYQTKNKDEKYGLLFVEILEISGIRYILNMMVDITKEIKAKKALKYKNEFLTILMKIFFKATNYSVENSNNFINDAIEDIGRFIEADRVYIFDYDFNNQTMSNTYEWCSDGIESKIKVLKDAPIQKPSWVKRHKEGKIIKIPNVSRYKSNDYIKKTLEIQNIKSLLSVPMMDKGVCLGFVGFDSVLQYKKYGKNEIELLKLFAQTLVDIRKKDKREKELLESLEEKSILMREIHHRVKNNLQLVSSLLYLQGSYIEDPKIKKALKDTENRVKTMAILHEKIYRTKEINRLNFKEYIEEIIKELLKSYKIDKKIKLYADIEDVDLNIDTAINCGLIVNELVTNAIQHAFNNRKTGEIKINIYNKNENVNIEVSDNGEGFKKKFEFIKDKSLGLQIVDSLVKQLKGSIKKEEVQGTKFIIEFKNKEGDKNE